MNEQQIQNLNDSIIRLSEKMDSFHFVQEEIKDDVSKIKEAVYNPDSGLYARVKGVESFKTITSRFFWIFATGIIGVLTTILVMQLVGK